MLEIKNAGMLIAGLKSREKATEDGDLCPQVVLRMVLNIVEGAREALAPLRIAAYAKSFWSPKGDALSEEAILRLRHKIINTTTIIRQGSQEVSLLGDISAMKVRPMHDNALELDCKLTAQIDPALYEKLWRMKLSGTALAQIVENQLDVFTAAA